MAGSTHLSMMLHVADGGNLSSRAYLGHQGERLGAVDVCIDRVSVTIYGPSAALWALADALWDAADDAAGFKSGVSDEASGDVSGEIPVA